MSENNLVELKKFLDLMTSFLNFTVNCYPKNIEYVS